MTPPDSLTQRLDIYRACGRVYREADELFTKTSWLAVMNGQCADVVADDPLALAMPDDLARGALSRISANAASAVASMPDHAAFIAAHCAAPAARR